MRQLKSMKRILTFMLTIVLITGSLAVPTQAKAVKKSVKSVSITNVQYGKVVLKKGKSFKLKTKVVVTGKASKKLTFTSSNKKVATVSSKGTIKAVKKGNAKITVKSAIDKKKKAVVKVVVGTPVTKLTLDKKEASLKVGETITLKATLSPKKPSEKTVAFTSSNEKIATVTSKGVVTAKAEGTVKITAQAKDASGKKAVCTITVTKKEEAKEEKPQTPAPSVKPSDTPKPSEPEVQDPGDYYDPSEIYDYGLNNTVSSNDAWATPSIDAEGYSLKWSDNFEAETLNRDDWNVEEQKVGWVNAEQQAYVDSEENVFVKDGNLVLRPIRKKNADGTDSITSGRVNTQNKHDFTYGLFEARVKVPKGQGFLPAFWMMPTDEMLYGQWPKCGEIDVMEVMGQQTDKLYGTIHYGNPHGSRQGTAFADKGHDYSDEYHTYACEWEPGKITWYVDGKKYHEANRWYTSVPNQGTKAYPAPFDQPFYVILNLAVGGSWVGNIDDSTKLNPAAYVIDYVKVFQKDSYDENVKEPEDIAVDAEIGKNYVANSDFSEAESLSDDEGWKFMTQEGGEAKASIADGAIKIETTKAGSKNYAVQLVQADLPVKKGVTYKVSFEAKASANRSMNCAVKAPNLDYYEHMSENVSLTTEFKKYEYEFTMGLDSDPECRVEFNMGNANSTATIEIKNVSFVPIREASSDSDVTKVVLQDGNCIYNGSFDEGTNRMKSWEINVNDANKEDVAISVTNLKDGRRLSVDAMTGDKENVTISQNGLAIGTEKEYVVSFEAEAEEACTVGCHVLGQNTSFNITTTKEKYKYVISPEKILDHNLVLYLGQVKGLKLDNVRVEENLLIKNGSFNAGTAAYNWYAADTASASWGIDSLKNDNAAEITINNTGDNDWDIQLQQLNVPLVKGKSYKLTFKAKSDLDRRIRVILQGDKSKNYAVYSGENTVELTNEYQPFEKEFTMNYASDDAAFLSICMGSITKDEIITKTHVIDIDDIVLEEVEKEPEVSFENNLLLDSSFEGGQLSNVWAETIANWADGPGADASRTISGNTITYDIKNVGTEDWNIKLEQGGISLASGETYILSYDVISSVTRTIKSGVMSKGYVWYGGADPQLEANKEAHIETEFTMKVDDEAADFYISMGQIWEGEDDNKTKVDTPVGTVSISNLKLIQKNAPVVDKNILKNTAFTGNTLGSEWEETIANWADGPGADATRTISENTITYDIKNVGTEDWNIKLQQRNISLENGKTYKLSYDVISTVARTIKSGVMSTGYSWYGGQDPQLEANKETHIEAEFTMKVDDEAADFYISLGQIWEGEDDNKTKVDTPAGTVTISNIRLELVE